MKTLLNISSYGMDLEIVGPGWSWGRKIVEENGFDGFELYPVPGYDFKKIPKDLITGIHLRFFVILAPMWNEDRQRLLEIFDDEETIRHFYGGLTRQAIIDYYRSQLALAQEFGAEYVVFHAAHCELDYVYQWNFPWNWQYIVDMSADIINAVTEETNYDGWILYENLWWPGSFTLNSPEEIARLLNRTRYEKCGIILDTGHLLNQNANIKTEKQGIDYILKRLNQLGDACASVKGLHLSRSLSGAYIRESRRIKEPYAGASGFWERLSVARRHVLKIDQHDAFEDQAIQKIFDYIHPEFTVFEFLFNNREIWMDKVNRQKKAVFSNNSN